LGICWGVCPPRLYWWSFLEQHQQQREAEGGSEHNQLSSPDDLFQNPVNWKAETNSLAESGTLFVHTTVVSTEQRDAVVRQQGSDKFLSICTIDT
jgi:hypothetical protein